MKESTQKEKVLKNVRDALVNSMKAPFENVDPGPQVFEQPDPSMLDIVFAEAFSNAGGKFIYCANTNELDQALSSLMKKRGILKLYCSVDIFAGLMEDYGVASFYDSADIDRCDASLTTCEMLISRLGSIVVSSVQGGGRKGFISTPVHIIIASTRQLVPDIKSAFDFLQRKYGPVWPSFITFITGPSRTADIEMSLVYGAHGPRDVYLFLLDADGDQ